jgi:hypothetical protein
VSLVATEGLKLVAELGAALFSIVGEKIGWLLGSEL